MLSVDDDSAVCRALARDLRRRYGVTYRIMRADSGPAAIEAVRELTVRGEQLAVLVADQRMPGMTGIEFLEQAMDLAPRAKRVLLTAYADTQAAIRAINEVDLDRYLLKPWDPPEEHLYPVLDELLEEWARAARPAFEGMTLLGHQWSAKTQQLREFLVSNQVPFRHLRGEEATEVKAAARLDNDAFPALIMADGVVLSRPSLREVAERAGLATTAGNPLYDVVVIGGGPAGLGAAVYAASEGLRTLLVDRAALGGQAGQSSLIENYLGFPRGVSGLELAQRARDQATKFDVEALTAAEVVEVAARGEGRVVRFADGNEVTAHAVVLASGVTWRRLPARGADRLAGRGIYYGATAHEATTCVDEEVYLVGAANSAGQAALHFARYAKRVVLLVRARDLRQRMSEYLVSRIEQSDVIEVRTGTEVIAAEGEDRLERLVLGDPNQPECRAPEALAPEALAPEPLDSGSLEIVPASRLYVFIGAEPQTDWLGEGFVRDKRGFLLTGPALLDVDGRTPASWPLARAPYHLESSVPGVFVAGDARAESVKRVAAAVGEGAMAVTLIHRYLESV